MEYIRFKNSCNLGDLISYLAGIKKICNDQNNKAIIYQRLDMIGEIGMSGLHPIKNENGVHVTFDKKTFDMVKPLLLAQDYIDSFLVWEGHEVDIDLDKTRHENNVGLPFGSMQNWAGMLFPQMQPNLCERWIEVPYIKMDEAIKYENSLLINFTERYRNNFISYYFLQQYQDNIVFAGLQKEHEIFCKQWCLNIPLLKIENFLELAQAMYSCKFFLGNQSFMWHLAEAMKIPRILDMSMQYPNCIHGIGEYSYGYITEAKAQWCVKELFEKL